MNHWLETSKENLIPLSSAQDFLTALNEWQFTGSVSECEPEEVCELCEHPDLNHRYEIKNQINSNKLLVGSSCILKFNEIKVLDFTGQDITDKETRKIILELALKDKLKEIMLEPLRSLWLKDKTHRIKIQLLAKDLKNDEGVSPSDLLYLFSRMQAHSIGYEPKKYKIAMRSHIAQMEIINMLQKNFLQIASALSKSQLVSAAKLRGNRS
jgi:hypothetical protein